MNEENGFELLRYFINEIVDFMHIPLHWGGYTFTLWEGLCVGILFSVTGYCLAKVLFKDD